MHRIYVPDLKRQAFAATTETNRGMLKFSRKFASNCNRIARWHQQYTADIMTNRDLRSARGRARIARNGEGKRRGGDGDDSAIKERRTIAHAAAAA